jgi:hypothetical protein
MPSANTVAQKPVGNFNPLLSFGQEEPFVCFEEVDWLRTGIELSRHSPATKLNRIRFIGTR